MIKRAEEHRVVLFDVDTLEKLLAIHQKTPQKLSTYRKVFQQAGKADLSVLDSDIIKTEKTGTLIAEIMSCLIDECQDTITKGKLSVRDLYMSLRGNTNLFAIPSIDEIETVLDFLSSPIINCVVKEKEYYYATASLNDMANILSFLQKRCYKE